MIAHRETGSGAVIRSRLSRSLRNLHQIGDDAMLLLELDPRNAGLLRRFPKSVLSCLAKLVHSADRLRGSGVVNSWLCIVTKSVDTDASDRALFDR